jgi:hypothetical protein
VAAAAGQPAAGQPAAGSNAGAVSIDSVNTSANSPTVQALPLVGSLVCFTLAGSGFVWLRRRQSPDDPDLTAT